jgi:hypothetical protein
MRLALGVPVPSGRAGVGRAAVAGFVKMYRERSRRGSLDRNDDLDPAAGLREPGVAIEARPALPLDAGDGALPPFLAARELVLGVGVNEVTVRPAAGEQQKERNRKKSQSVSDDGLDAPSRCISP